MDKKTTHEIIQQCEENPPILITIFGWDTAILDYGDKLVMYNIIDDPQILKEYLGGYTKHFKEELDDLR